ncbi:uncharacterized protein LOC123670856 [Harmonia axyridis]|uniref:uncharacterized protein LOC123670856 n=1 Tax=Harmonia axyridis TaxID=115357 RepID=UPI001E2764D5|nr:uncharacterized protein LOC123670856 [Harmonia axyridis]
MGKEMNNLIKNIQNSETEETIQELTNQIHRRQTYIITECTKTYNKKLETLTRRTNIQMDTKYLTDDTIENITQATLPPYVIDTLKLGAKFAIEDNNIGKVPTHQILAHIEGGITKLPTDEQNDIRMKVSQTLSSHIKNIKGQKQRHNKHLTNFTKTKKFFKEHNELLITRADKGNKTVIMTNTEYEEKMSILLKDNTTYIKTKRDMTLTLEKENNKIIKNWKEKGFISEIDYKTLIIHNSKTPKIYGLPKIHKEGNPLRPIVSCVQSPLYHLSKYLAEILTRTTGNNEYYIKNSIELKEQLNKLKINKNDKLYSLDVVSLYTNIPIELVKEYI